MNVSGTSGASSRIALRWKISPSTDASTSRARSSLGSPSSRAASSVWNVVGTGTASRPSAATQRAPSQLEQVVVDQHCQQLLGEQRVAVGGLGDPRRRVGGQWPAAEQVRDQRPAVAVVERLEQHRRGVELAAAPAGMAVEELGPRHAEQQDRRVARELGQVLDERRGTSARPTAGRRRRSRAGGAARAPRRACAPPRTSPRPCRRRCCRGRAPRRSARRSARPSPRREAARRSQRSTTPSRTIPRCAGSPARPRSTAST